MGVNITGGSGSGSGIKGTAAKVGAGIGVGLIIGWGVSNSLQNPSEAGEQPETYGTLFFGPEDADKNLSDGHEKLYIAEKGGDVSVIDTAVFEPTWGETNLTAMDAKYNGSSFLDKLKEDGQSVETWNISYELDNMTHAMTLVAKKGSITYKSDAIPFEELRGKDGKLAKVGGVTEIRVLPRAILQDEPFEMKVSKNIITQELYTNANITNEANGTYEKAQISMPDDWMDEKLVADVTFLEKAGNEKANRTGKVNITGIAEFFDQMDNGKIDGSSDDFIKDFNSMAYGSYQSGLAQDYKQLALNTMQTLNDTRALLEDMKDNFGKTNTSYETRLAAARMQLTNMTANYTHAMENLTDARELITQLKTDWSNLNKTLEEFDKKYTHTTDADRHAIGRVFYNNLMNATEKAEMLKALGIDQKQWDAMFDDNNTEVTGIELVIPGLNETANITVKTTANEISGKIAREYAVNIEKKLLENKEGMIDYSAAGMKPDYLASLQDAALEKEIAKLRALGWTEKLTYSDSNNSKFASIANIFPDIYNKVGTDWSNGDIELEFVDTQNGNGLGGVYIAKNINTGKEKAYTLPNDMLKKVKDIVSG